MGEFKFRLPAEWSMDRRQASAIHTVGIDGIPWPCKISASQEILTVSRNRNEAGRTYVLFSFEKYGELMVATGTLVERADAYALLPELARGTLNRLRNQFSIWQEGGLEIPASVFDAVAASVSYLGNALMQPVPEQQDHLARQSLESSLDAMFEISLAFGDQVSEFRRTSDAINPFWFANTLSPAQPIKEGIDVETFELVRMDFDQLSSAGQKKLKKRVIAGPFLDASFDGMSQELVDAGKFSVRKSKLLKSCQDQLKNISSSASLIHVIGGLNGMGHRNLSYSQQLELATALLEEVSDSNLEIPTLVSFDFPWAERLASAVGGSHPLQIADTLLRQGAQISMLGIEVNLGYWPNGSALRDPLQWIEMLDLWSQLGIPLVILLRVPTWTLLNGEERKIEPNSSSSSKQVNSLLPQSDSFSLDYLKTIFPMLVARPAVQGVIWSQWLDGDDPRFPHGGLVDDHDQIKQMLEILSEVKR